MSNLDHLQAVAIGRYFSKLQVTYTCSFWDKEPFWISCEIKLVIKMQSASYLWHTIFLKQCVPTAVASQFSLLEYCRSRLHILYKKRIGLSIRWALELQMAFQMLHEVTPVLSDVKYLFIIISFLQVGKFSHSSREKRGEWLGQNHSES